MANDAHICIYGTVLNDPTNRQVNSSTVLSFRVAVKTTKKQEGSQWPASDIYDVSLWGKTAENVINKVKAKSKVVVFGNFMIGEPWQDRQGKEHMSLKVTGTDCTICGGSSSTSNYNNNNNNNNNNNTQQAPAEDEEAPF